MILVSECLLGIPCRYNGEAKPSQECIDELKGCQLLKVCPEVLGGLPIPRPASEIQKDGKIMSKVGDDVTEAFRRGAEKTLQLAKENHVKYAILKARSPSCGHKKIYDGTFTGTLIDGQGIAAQLLEEAGITVFSEEDAPFQKIKNEKWS